MCRFVLYLGSEISVSSLVTEPSNSIIHQSFHSHERAEPLNGDGFGIGWYAPLVTDRPAIFKDVTPAWNNMNLRNIAAVTRSRCVFAHVRAATLGLPVTFLNCHPFAWGPFAFMHNGSVGGFARMRRRLLARLSDDAFGLVQGSTDSEHVFALFVDRYRQSHSEPTFHGKSGGVGALDYADTPSGSMMADRTEAMRRAMEAAIADVESLRQECEIDEPSSLNLALTDGHGAVITRYVSRDPDTANTLYVSQGESYACAGGVCRMSTRSDERNRAVLVASEPLSENEMWERVKPNHIVTVDSRLKVRMEPIETPPR
jgi:predicted glutamine amidotransferase